MRKDDCKAIRERYEIAGVTVKHVNNIRQCEIFLGKQITLESVAQKLKYGKAKAFRIAESANSETLIKCVKIFL